MSLQTPAITNALLSMTISNPALSPLTDTIAIKEALTFAGVANLQVISGTFTPANNQVNPGGAANNSIPSAIAPNFMLILCDGQLNVSIGTNNQASIVDMPVNKMLLFTMPTGLTGAQINQIIFDGRTVLAAPMAQGVAVNYTIIWGQATIS